MTPKDEEARSLGLALLILRRSRGMTPAALSAAAGVTRSQLSCYETGKRMPRRDNLRRLVAAMDFPVGALYQAQRAVDEVMGRETSDDAGGDGTLPPDVRPEMTREAALRLAQEIGKAFAHVALAFLELQAGGWRRPPS